jgi:hypothetical protein
VPLHAGQRCSAGPSSRSVPFFLELLLIPPSMVSAFVITLQPGGSSTLSVTDVGHGRCDDHPHILPLCTVGDIKVPMGMAFSDFAQFPESTIAGDPGRKFWPPTPFASEADLAYARGDCLERREAALKEWEAFCNSRAKAGGLKLVA